MGMDVKAIQEILRMVNKSDITEVEIEQKDFKLVVKRQGSATPTQYVQQAGEVIHLQPAPIALPTAPAAIPAAQPAAPAAPAAASAATPAAGGKVHTITSPMIGTFYRKPGPDKPDFVKVGDKISKGQVLCIVEAMKLFNEIESEVSGTIVRILLEDAKPVEYEQPIFEVELD